MANPSKRVDIQNLLTLGDDLIGVLNNRKDGDGLMQSFEGAKMLRSSCLSDTRDLQSSLEDYQKKISACKEMIEKAKGETIDDAELEHLQSELEGKLQSERLLHRELRAISDELDELDHQRASFEERKEIMKRQEKDELRSQDLLSMCASVTNILPNLDDQDMISGYIVEKSKKKVEKFAFDKTTPQLEVCSKLWKGA